MSYSARNNDDDLAAFIAWLRSRPDPHEAEIAARAAQIAAAHPDWPAALVRQQATWRVWRDDEPPAPDLVAWGLG